MREHRKKTAVRILVILPYLLLLYILQGIIFTRLPIFGAKPMLLPIAVVGIAIFEGKIPAGIIGILCGMLCDMTFNEPTVIFTISLCFIGLIIGYLAETVLVVGMPTYLCLSLAVLILCAFIQVFPLIFISRQAPAPIISAALNQVCASMLFTVPIYYLTRFVGRVL